MTKIFRIVGITGITGITFSLTGLSVHGQQTSIKPMGHPTTLSCPMLLPAPADGCTMSGQADSKDTLMQGIVLVDEKVVIKNGVVAWNAIGKITFVGCPKDLGDLSKYRVIACSNTVVSPGLINAHDHIKYNNETPDSSLWGNIRYNRRHEWISGLNGKPSIPYTRDNSPEKVSWTELRQLIAGTTSIAGSSGSAKGLLRNVDAPNGQEGLQGGVVNYLTFPLGDLPKGGHTGHTDTCAYPRVADPTILMDSLKFLPHVGEGIDDFAHNEVLCLTGRGTHPNSPGVNFQSPKTSFIHAIATTLEDAKIFKNADMSVIWSPRSNLALYGHTPPVVMYDKLGINIALSSDWAPSGSINLQRELICASHFNSRHLGGHFSKAQLWSMVTVNAAHSLGFADQIGKLAVGLNADIMAIAANGETYGAVWATGPSSVRLVMRGGTPLFGDEELITSLGANHCDPLDICGANKSLCLESEIGMRYAALAKANADSYPINFCGIPKGEPMCVPSRPNEYPIHPIHLDWDQDGVYNTQDNCPRVFNPPRPMDASIQPGYFCKVDPEDAHPQVNF